MKLIALSVMVLVAAAGTEQMPLFPSDGVHPSTVVEHGGGCRKSSPAGQCCHKNHKTGVVHCH